MKDLQQKHDNTYPFEIKKQLAYQGFNPGKVPILLEKPVHRWYSGSGW